MRMHTNQPGHYTHRVKGGDYEVLGLVKASSGFIGCKSGEPISLFNISGEPGMYATPDTKFYTGTNRRARYASATLAGSEEVFKDDWLQLYQCRVSGKMYVRLLSDFNRSMRRLTDEEIS